MITDYCIILLTPSLHTRWPGACFQATITVPSGVQHGDREATETSVIEFCY